MWHDGGDPNEIDRHLHVHFYLPRCLECSAPAPATILPHCLETVKNLAAANKFSGINTDLVDGHRDEGIV